MLCIDGREWIAYTPTLSKNVTSAKGISVALMAEVLYVTRYVRPPGFQINCRHKHAVHIYQGKGRVGQK